MPQRDVQRYFPCPAGRSADTRQPPVRRIFGQAKILLRTIPA